MLILRHELVYLKMPGDENLINEYIFVRWFALIFTILKINIPPDGMDSSLIPVQNWFLKEQMLANFKVTWVQ